MPLRRRLDGDELQLLARITAPKPPRPMLRIWLSGFLEEMFAVSISSRRLARKRSRQLLYDRYSVLDRLVVALAGVSVSSSMRSRPG